MAAPHNPLAGFALLQIDGAITLYTAAVQSRPSRSMVNNLQWLLRLRHRAEVKMASASATMAADTMPGEGVVDGDRETEDVELLGWRTRLIQRAPKSQTATTISEPSPLNTTGLRVGTGVSPNTVVAATITNALQARFAPTGAFGSDLNASPQDISTEALVRTQKWQKSAARANIVRWTTSGTLCFFKISQISLVVHQ